MEEREYQGHIYRRNGPGEAWQMVGPARQQAPASSGPVFVPGAPKPVDPMEAERLELARNADARAQQDQARQQQMAPIQQQAALADLENKGKLQESERTAGFLATRLAGAFKDIATITSAHPKETGPSIGAAIAGGLFGPVAQNMANSPTRRQIEAAQLDALDSALTLGTGAAYNKEQLEGYRQSYFPQIGDDQATIDAKRTRFMRLIEAAKIKAGDAAPQIDTALKGVLGNAPPVGALDPGQYDAQLGKMVREGASREDILRFAAESGYRIDNPEVIDQLRGRNPRIEHNAPDYGEDFMRGVGGVVQGVGDILGIVANPVNAGINAAFGTNLSTDIGTSLRRDLGLPFPDSSGERLTDAITRGGTAGLLTAGAAGAAAAPAAFAGGAGPGGGGPVMNALARVAAAPTIDTAAGATGSLASEATRQGGGGTLAQIGAGIAAGGGVAGAAGLARTLSQPRVGNALLQAAERQRVQPLAADLGGTTTRRLTAGAAQGPLSAGPIVARAAKAQEQLRGAAGRAANAEGSVLPIDEAGAAVRKAGALFSAQSAQRGGRLYERARELAGDIKLEPSRALQVIDEQIARLGETAEVNAPLITELQKFRASLAKGNGISVSGLRGVRTIAGKAAYTEALRSTPAREVLRQVSDALADDIAKGLTSAGKARAAQAFRIADKFWAERVDEIDSVLEPIIGKGKSGEDVLQAFEGMAQGRKGGVSRLSRMIRLLPEQEAGDVRATIIDRLGKATAGQQNAEGTAFSAQTFLSNWNRMSPKAKATLFPDGETRQTLNDVATMADGMRQSQRFANHSNTAGGVATQVMLSGGVGALGGVKGLAIAALAQMASGRLLASNWLMNWVGRAPTTTSPRYVDRLAAVATKDPGIASEVKAMQQRIQEAMSSLPQRAAASSGPNPRNDERQRREEVPQR